MTTREMNECEERKSRFLLLPSTISTDALAPTKKTKTIAFAALSAATYWLAARFSSQLPCTCKTRLKLIACIVEKKQGMRNGLQNDQKRSIGVFRRCPSRHPWLVRQRQFQTIVVRLTEEEKKGKKVLRERQDDP